WGGQLEEPEPQDAERGDAVVCGTRVGELEVCQPQCRVDRRHPALGPVLFAVSPRVRAPVRRRRQAALLRSVRDRRSGGRGCCR
ncbi:unnamed protein product, partial [Ectocarpus fasciculatus]